ncbi:hypothetical protein ACEWY4_008076 [Coilia grayii]|uniref:DDE Tnp4 domain-containing protein n=1 Tax=Coilia grayii TaxID=363190 RepID=A0ABD1KAM5_9TELE
MTTERQRIMLELELINVEQQLVLLKSLQRKCQQREPEPRRCFRKKKKEKVRIRQRRWCVQPRNLARPEEGEYCVVSKALNDIDDEMLFGYFHMSADKFVELVGRLQPFIKHQCTHMMPIDVRQRVAIALRFLASGESQKHVAASYKLASSTVSSIVSEVCKALWKALQTEFIPCPSVAQWEAIKADFWQQWSFPNCVGSIDGKLVNLRSPRGKGSSQVKNAPPIAFVATCDARYRFTMVEVETYAQESDGDIFKNSTLGSKLLEEKLDLPPPTSLPESAISVPHVFVADAAFPLHNNLMRPFQGINLSTEKQTYNLHHSRVRRVMENTLGILVARWRVLSRPLEFFPDKAIHVLKACIVLHNFLTSADDVDAPGPKYISANFADTDTLGSIQPGEWRTVVTGDTNLLDPVGPQYLSRSHSKCDGIGVRNHLMTFFHSFHEVFPL